MTSATIWKYEISVEDFVEIEVPDGSTFLDVQIQNGKVVLWYIVRDKEAPTKTVKFRIYGTGHLFDNEPQLYRGTFQLYGGDFVGHLFERTV